MSMMKTGRRAALAAVAVLVAGPAAAVPGLSRHSDSTENNSVSPKTAIAVCPPGKQVVGGGAFVIEQFGQVVLTHLEPIDGDPRDSYVVSAEEPAAGISGNWGLEAIALCANPLAGHQIVSRTTSPASLTFVPTEAVCPSGKRVIGTGSRIINSGGSVGLQLSRASGLLDISRSTARERASGYLDSWSLTSYAICVNPADVTVKNALDSDNSGFVCCEPGCSLPNIRVHSAGGGGSLENSGPFFLQVLAPQSDLTRVFVFMTGPPDGGMVSQAICGGF